MTRFVPDWLRRATALDPGRTALIAPGVRWSYGELDARCDAAAARLVALGARPADRVALLARNVPDAVVLVHALRRIGAVFTPIHPRSTADEIAWQLADSGARLLFHDGPHSVAAQSAATRVEGARPLSLDALACEPAQRPLSVDVRAGGQARRVRLRERVDLSAPQGLLYTSGTTGWPKGVLLSHGNHWWSAVGSGLRLGVRQDDRWLVLLPLAHVGGLAVVLRAAMAATAIVLHEAFDPAQTDAALDDHGVSVVSVVEDILRRMLEARGARPFPPTLRCVLLGGGPVGDPLLAACARRGLPVARTYGLTEAASQVATQLPGEGLRDVTSCGVPLAVTEVRIERDGRTAGADEEGEITVRGPTVMLRYAGDPEATARALDRGWLHTGDIGRLDARGRLHVLDRRDALIRSGGEKISPAEVERVLSAHPAVDEALVSGVAHDRWGQVPEARVVLRSDATAGEVELLAHCRLHLASFKVPVRVRIVQRLPRGPGGKLLRSP